MAISHKHRIKRISRNITILVHCDLPFISILLNILNSSITCNMFVQSMLLCEILQVPQNLFMTAIRPFVTSMDCVEWVIIIRHQLSWQICPESLIHATSRISLVPCASDSLLTFEALNCVTFIEKLLDRRQPSSTSAYDTTMRIKSWCRMEISGLRHQLERRQICNQFSLLWNLCEFKHFNFPRTLR